MEKLAKQESMGRNELESIVTMALDEARSRGADQAEVAASHDIGLAATARLGDVENLEYTNDRGVGITVYKESRKGSASTWTSRSNPFAKPSPRHVPLLN